MVKDRIAKLRPQREIEGMAACLLPFEADGSIAVEAFQAAIKRTEAAGLKCAINMDTGYANYLTAAERRMMLQYTQEVTNGKGFVGGVFVQGLEGDLVDLYRKGMDEVVEFGGTPIIFQTTRFQDWPEEKIAELYATICEGYESVLGFELGRMFAPNGMIYTESLFKMLMQIPSLKGLKHSSLSRGEELKRLELRDAHRPDFKVYTGNDLGIDMIEYGSDYLLGLATFCPEKFAERDRLWKEGDPAYYELNDALQYLGNVGFRADVPAYKHSCAVFQHLLGRVPTSEPHPMCPRRPDWEEGIMRDCALRLGYTV